MMKEERKLASKVHKGFAKQKRSRPLQKYREMGVAVDKFFKEVQDAHGAVPRGLLECFKISSRLLVPVEMNFGNVGGVFTVPRTYAFLG